MVILKSLIATLLLFGVVALLGYLFFTYPAQTVIAIMIIMTFVYAYNFFEQESR